MPKTAAQDSTYDRPAAVAGTFYPAAASLLDSDIAAKLAAVPQAQLQCELKGIVTPHAGYVYSGAVAATAFRQLRGRQYDTVILLGPSHYFRFPGVAVHAQGSFSTPLGSVPVDADCAADLIAAHDAIQDLPDVHAPEHDLEVQLPFLQKELPPFAIVPVVIQDFSDRNCALLADALTRVMEERNALLLTTTDLAHYPQYEDAVESDTAMIQAMESFEPREIRDRSDAYLSKSIPNLQVTMCGLGPVIAGMKVAHNQGSTGFQALKYANSGDVPTGGRSQVVGYVGGAFVREQRGAA